MWRPIGLVLHERWSTEVTCEAGPVRAVVRVSRLRVGVDFSMVSPADTAHLALAAAHRLAASALEQVAAAEGWFAADPTVRAIDSRARVVITGGQASAAAMTFFGSAVGDAFKRSYARCHRCARCGLTKAEHQLGRGRDCGAFAAGRQLAFGTSAP